MAGPHISKCLVLSWCTVWERSGGGVSLLEEVRHQAVFLSACHLSLPPKPLFHSHSLALFFRKRCSPLPQFPRGAAGSLPVFTSLLATSEKQLLLPCPTLLYCFDQTPLHVSSIPAQPCSLHSTHAESLGFQMKTTSKAAFYSSFS